MRSISLLIALLVFALMGCNDAQARQVETEMEREEIEAELEQARDEMREAARRLAELSAMLNEPHLGGSIHHVIRNMRGPRLGISITHSDDPLGVKVIDVIDGSAAAEAGLREGDVITAANDQPLDSGDEPLRALGEVIRSHDSDQPLRLEVLRDGETVTVEARLPEAPEAPVPPRMHVEMEEFRGPHPAMPSPPDVEIIRERVRHAIGGLGALGPVRLTPMNEGLSHYFGTSEGLLVLSASEDSQGQLRAGDIILSVNGEAVNRMGDIIRLLRGHRAGDNGEPIEVEILRQGNRQTLSIEPGNGPLAWIAPH